MELDLILMLSFLLFGVLCVFNAFRLRRATKLFDSMVLYPGGMKKEDCQDPAGFMAFVRPRIGILGGGCLLIAGVYALKLYVGISKYVSIGQYVFAAALLAWGFWLYHRAAKQFW